MAETGDTYTGDTTASNTGMTSYAILRRCADGLWEHLDGHDGFGGDAAIRGYLAGKPKADAEGTYVAIPARSFKPVTVKAETTTILKIDPT